VTNQADVTSGATGARATDPAEVLRALAHPVRWGILCRLAAEPGICACDFTEFFDVSQPTISAHLKVLREAGLVTTRRNGTTICYSIAPGHLESLSRLLAEMAASAAQLGTAGAATTTATAVPSAPRVEPTA
jgi:ArsR family transcriptional regulator, arsenate/arsenite/antimonite-responsive transcriptional repressor